MRWTGGHHGNILYSCQVCDSNFWARPSAQRKYCNNACFQIDKNQKRPDKFWALVNKTNTCWLWEGYIADHGYGRFRLGSERYTHRIAYRELIGSIPRGLVVDHLCRNRACVNPEHMELVTRGENVLRGISVGSRAYQEATK